MSKHTQKNTKPTKNSLELREFKGEPTIVISDELFHQVNTLHSLCGGDEWSGVLLYKIVEGDITDPDSLLIECVGVFPMDVGTPTYTEFESDPDSIIDMAERYPDYEEGKLYTGLIHTHHGMKTSFSKTDHEELQDNAEAHNAYLSLIVNFDMTPSAKIAFKVSNEIDNKYTFKDTKGKSTTLVGKSKEEFIAVYQCMVQFESINNNEWIVERVIAIEEREKLKREARRAAKTDTKYDNGNQLSKYMSDKYKKNLLLVDIRSFICKVMSLNPNYVGGEVAVCASTMNAKILSYKGKNKTVKQIEEGYRKAAEDHIDGAMELVFGKVDLDTQYEVLKEAISLLQTYKNYMVAEVVSSVLSECLSTQEEEEFVL